MIEFQLNGEPVSVDVPADTPLLWIIREHFQLTGSKFGCGMGLCGACTMHVDGIASRTCILPVVAVAGKSVTTIEGLGDAEQLHPVQEAWLEHNVPQCGYCQPGQIMSASALLATNPKPSDSEIEAAMSGNICRCGTYPRIRKAIKSVAAVQQFDPAEQAAGGDA
ncbi:(2Fe-2S)-binding protein [Pseudoteredinibacter isoporae]|uniref:Isoquinoline 1-oxidoreductase alpha subunit n=1 Tax=Pseudoteredinibacter isoporae TaxID=570281 RepID=A0A7X0JSM5_9GAMM|nr:(2Fe-2S)-binding protein [Pseudoteredinibacter isoporae]MBB6520646.1 isoquinoline 1-oxidoreductase alpha subunit [Pseudoteredinibacter isoporae]NHO86213.1 (2Fe-2S)-binding protein [Pseudoteredinibacter isoporae]NIB25336.1 (2Fe-2S)-binding protein [Pseudoteredinibacter isoporae]